MCYRLFKFEDQCTVSDFSAETTSESTSESTESEVLESTSNSKLMDEHSVLLFKEKIQFNQNNKYNEMFKSRARCKNRRLPERMKQ